MEGEERRQEERSSRVTEKGSPGGTQRLCDLTETLHNPKEERREPIV